MSKYNKVYNLLLSLIISSISTSTVVAQQSGINLDVNLGASPNSPLRKFHTDLAEQITLDNFDTTSSFLLNYGFTLGFTAKNIKSSFFYANRVSGAKTSVADYTGYVRLTNELNGHTIGYKYYKVIGNDADSNLFFQFKALVTFSSLNIVSNYNFIGQTQIDTVDFKSTDIGLGAGIVYEYPISFMVLRAYIDLDIYYGGKIKLKEDNPEGAFLLDGNGDKITTGWGGITTGLGITIPL